MNYTNQNKQQVQQHIEVPAAPPKPTFIEELKAYQDFIVAVITVLTPMAGIVGGVMIWRFKARIAAENKQRLIDLAKENREDEYVEKTIWNYKGNK